MSELKNNSRRSALKGIIAAMTATVGVTASSAANAWSPRIFKSHEVIVWRLRTRGTKSCNTCKVHHRYLIFKTKELADANRAHPGCNCPIVPQALNRWKYYRMFAGTDGVVTLPRNEKQNKYPGKYRRV